MGWRTSHALSLPTYKALTSTAALSGIFLTIVAYSEDFQAGRQQIVSQTVSNYHLPKNEDMDPNHPASPTAALFLWFVCFCDRKWAPAGNKLLNHHSALTRPSGNLCWVAVHRSSDRFGFNKFCFQGTVRPNSISLLPILPLLFAKPLRYLSLRFLLPPQQRWMQCPLWGSQLCSWSYILKMHEHFQKETSNIPLLWITHRTCCQEFSQELFLWKKVVPVKSVYTSSHSFTKINDRICQF